ncbi:Hypothetical predicted protein [Octopus vulgaris]|uniref:Uncharacterized protein n=1 Tax=Octopus vulgaris TaxID=6645 RepID=A0AA36ATJ8_OCTVU|nr:Hypothetical predicted protein [Octopus vulgaris]
MGKDMGASSSSSSSSISPTIFAVAVIVAMQITVIAQSFLSLASLVNWKIDIDSFLTICIHSYFSLSTHTHTYIFIYVYIGFSNTLAPRKRKGT